MVHTQARRSGSYGQRGPHDTLLCHTTPYKLEVDYRTLPEAGNVR